jgi:hypothetical protein
MKVKDVLLIKLDTFEIFVDIYVNEKNYLKILKSLRGYSFEDLEDDLKEFFECEIEKIEIEYENNIMIVLKNIS